MQRLGRILGNLFAIALTVLSLSAIAESQLAGRDFNHMSTGFPLSGGHATAACETCHIGGVFKGTPRVCDGCHAVGKRIVATPKSNSHIVTDAPCESCHFNTATWFGARFNHGNALPGQCATCHNGRLSFAKPSTHSTGNKATKSCDSCHRSSAWLPASWNHTAATVGVCKSCHISSPEVTSENRLPAGHNSPIPYTTRLRNVDECDACHSFVGWRPAAFNHNVAGACSSCHTKIAGHIAIALNADCGACHRTRSYGWKPASMHTGNEQGICRDCHASTPQPTTHTAVEYTSLSCDVCHKSQTTWTGASGHIDLVPPHVPTCRSCHSNRSHDGKDGANSSMDCSRSGCHRPGGNEGRQFSSW